MKKMLVAIVKWKDHTSQDAWIDPGEEWKEHSILHEVVSIGWLKEEHEDRIILVSAVDEERDCHSMIQVIGKSMIIEMKVGGRWRKNGLARAPKCAGDAVTHPRSEAPESGT